MMNAEISSKHQSYIFFLSEDGQVAPIPASTYVALVRGESTMREYAGHQVRVADYYVALQDGKPMEVQNETYSFLSFDQNGRADLRHGRFAQEQNEGFYQTALASHYDDIDCDPEIRKLRERLGDEFSWLPKSEERQQMRFVIFERRPIPE